MLRLGVTRSRVLRASSVAVVLCLLACGDDVPAGGGEPSDFGACGQLVGCGGSLAGTWNVTAVCTDGLVQLHGPASEEPACDGLIVESQSSGVGTIAFGNATLMSNAVISVDMTARYTPACVSAIAGGQAVDFAAVCSSLSDQYALMTSVSGASCEVVDANCDCILSVDLPLSTYINYTLSDSTSTIMSQGALASLAFCAKDNQLQLGGRIGPGWMLLTLTK